MATPRLSDVPAWDLRPEWARNIRAPIERDGVDLSLALSPGRPTAEKKRQRSILAGWVRHFAEDGVGLRHLAVALDCSDETLRQLLRA